MDVLRKIGLTKYETLLYQSLLSQGRSNAAQLADSSSVPKTAVYPTLRKLVHKQLVQELKGDITLFEALPPNLALKEFIEKQEQSLKELKEEAILLSESLRNTKKPQEKKEVMWLSHGKEASRLFYLSSFEKAKHSVFILGWRFEQVDDKYVIAKYFKDLLKREVDVRIILIGSLEKQSQLIKDYKNMGVKIRYLPLDNFSIFICDGNECKITLKDRTMSSRFNMHVNDKSLANALQSYFLECWKKAKEI